jgi:hypothetical protein
MISKDFFARYELDNYVLSKQLLKDLKVEKVAVIEHLYDDCSPSTRFYDTDSDRWLKSGVNTEDMAIEIILTREAYDKRIERHEEKVKVFEKALSILTDRERDAIDVQYFRKQDTSGLSKETFRKILAGADRKLSSYLYNQRIEADRRKTEARKEALREQVRQFKGVR